MQFNSNINYLYNMEEPNIEKSLKLVQLENQLLKTNDILGELRNNSSNHQLIRMAMQNISFVRKEIEEEKSKQPIEVKKLKPNPKTFRGKQKSKTSLIGNLQKLDKCLLDVPSSEVKKILIETCSGTRRNRHFIKVEDLDNLKDYLDTLLLKPVFNPYQWHFKCPANLDGKGCDKSCNILLFFERLRTIGYNDKVEEFINYVTEKVYEKEQQIVKYEKLAYPTISCCPECNTFDWLTKIKSRSKKNVEFDNELMRSNSCLITCICKNEYCAKCNKYHSAGTKCIFKNYWDDYDEEAKSNYKELIKDHKGQICPNCKHFWDKDEECDKVKCNICNTKFCFTCGEDITDLGNNYLSHLISGPKIIGNDDGNDIHFRCTRTYVRKACNYLNDQQEHKYLFEFMVKSLLCEKIFFECSKILMSDHPLDLVNEKSKIFLKICMIICSGYHKKFFLLNENKIKFVSCEGTRIELLEGIELILDNEENSFNDAPDLMSEYFKNIVKFEGYKDLLNEMKEIIKDI